MVVLYLLYSASLLAASRGTFLEFVDLYIADFLNSKDLSAFGRTSRRFKLVLHEILDLDSESSRRYIHNLDGYRDRVHRTRQSPRVRLNLGDDVIEYITDAVFRSRVDDLVGNQEKQVWSDVKSLDLRDVQNADFRLLDRCVDLTELFLSGDQLQYVSHLAQLKKLTKLFVDGNDLRDISPLSQLTSLTELRLLAHQVVDIAPLAELVNLTQLRLFANQLQGISPLAQLEKLTELYLASNQLEDISRLGELKKLGLLCIRAPSVSQAALRDLRRNLPDLSIYPF